MYHARYRRENLKTIRNPAGWWGSTMNRLASASLPLMAFVLFGSATIFLGGLANALDCWRVRRATADWVFPALVPVPFVVVPKPLNGVEARRIRYSIELLLFVAAIGAGYR